MQDVLLKAGRATAWSGAAAVLIFFLAHLPSARATRPDGPPGERSGRDLYLAACAACHGIDGTGAPPSQLAFDVSPPDFTDCSFATREPDPDWVAVAHEGGPLRAFDRIMPAFGDAMTDEELLAAVTHIRTFCAEPGWPSGDLNQPRAMFTEKAFVEDEAVLTVDVTAEERTQVGFEFIYETRIGTNSQIEVVVPFGFGKDPVGDDWSVGLGDMAVGLKTAPLYSKETGTILALTAELVLPTGDVDDGYGKGTPVAEPFISFGQTFGDIGFLHAQVGFELPFETDKAELEAFYRAALGRTFTEGPYGRAWTPMIEVLAAHELEASPTAEWDVVPQVQVTLPQRQHIALNLAVRLPVTDFEDRPTVVLAYLLWEWFDGGFFEGW